MVSVLDYFELDNQVINNKKVNSNNTIVASEFYMHKASKELGAIFVEAFKRTLETVFAAGIPVAAGKGPRGALITSQTQQALVNAGYRQSFVGDYFLFSKSNFSSGVFRKDIWALAYTGEEKAGNILSVLKAVEAEAKAVGATSIIIRGKQVVNESLLSISPKAAEKLGYQLEKIGEDIITLTKKF